MKKYILICITILILCGCSRENASSNDVSKREILEDKEIIQDIENLKKDEDENLFKKSFVMMTDFIFYEGEINGKTFHELRQESKDKILEIYQEMEEKIEEKYPGFSDEVSHKTKNSYEFLYEKSILLREKIIQEYQDKVGKENYQNVVDSYQEGKESIQNVIEEYEPIVIDEYESIKNRFSSWYQEYKEG